ncbi:MAG TPA: hypothetical protein VGM29_08050, partial [Polyangiaceae bacterium]
MTAKHVMECARAFPLGAGFVEKRGEPPVRLAQLEIGDDISDVVVVVLGESDEAGAQFIPVSQFDADQT